jgi:peptidoglycan/xylan/chitin deacetylase (PgdA/CDA1 family)
MSKRELLAQLVVRSGLLPMVASAYHARFKDVKVLAYHRVLPRLDEASFPYDIELVSTWQEEFDWQMRYLSRHYEVVTCRELAKFQDTGVWPDRPVVLVTFDDGYLDNHDVAWPVLRSHGLPAVIYVATGYADSGDMYWYDKLAFSVLHAGRREVSLKPGDPPIKFGTERAAREGALLTLLRYLKTIPDSERQAKLLQWHAALAPTVAPEEGTLHRPMNWDQIKALSDGGIEIGSHTVTHPVLSRLTSPDQLKFELTESKAVIERHTGREVLSMAYPTGGRSSYTDEVVGQVKAAGYRFAFSYESGLNQPLHWDPFRLRRSAVERYVTRERFQATLAAPTLFS